MEKTVPVTMIFCDFCEQRADTKCLLCGKDICDDHQVEVSIYANGPGLLTGGICPTDAAALFSILSDFKRESTNLMKRADVNWVRELKPEDIEGFFFQPKVKDEIKKADTERL